MSCQVVFSKQNSFGLDVGVLEPIHSYLLRAKIEILFCRLNFALSGLRYQYLLPRITLSVFPLVLVYFHGNQLTGDIPPNHCLGIYWEKHFRISENNAEKKTVLVGDGTFIGEFLYIRKGYKVYLISCSIRFYPVLFSMLNCSSYVLCFF